MKIIKRLHPIESAFLLRPLPVEAGLFELKCNNSELWNKPPQNVIDERNSLRHTLKHQRFNINPSIVLLFVL